MILPSFEDAHNRLNAAEEHLKRYDYAGAIFEAQRCLELSVKAFLEDLDIKYKERHDIGNDPFEKAIEKLGSQLKNEYQYRDAVLKLVKARVLMGLLASVRKYAEYGFLGIPAKDIFSLGYMSEIAKNLVADIRDIHWFLYNLTRI